jgi:predicted DNA-binding transcriptional regulator AlpA
MPSKHTPEAIPTALQYFDSLPNAAHVRQPILEILFACSGSTIWRRVKDGQIPKPLKLSERVTAWQVGELRAVLQGQGKRRLLEAEMTSDFDPSLSLKIDRLVKQEEAK